MVDVVTIAGSPASASKSAAVLGYARRFLEQNGVETGAIVVRELPAEDVLFGRFDSPAITASAMLITEAQVIIVATPVYKASFAGILKAFLDLLPSNALAGKLVLPIVTGGSPGHLLAIDYALKPVLAALGAQHILTGVYVLDGQLARVEDDYHLDEAIGQRLQRALDDVISHLSSRSVRVA